MPAEKIQMPERFFDVVIKIPVRITDINYGDHVGNDAFISIIHEARMQLLQHYHYSELNIEGIGLIMAELKVQFKNESFYKDIIEVRIGAANISRSSFTFIYQLTTPRENKHLLIAHAATTMVCYNYENKKVVSIPEQFIKLLNG